MNYLSKYLIEEAAAITSSAQNLDDREVSKALELLDCCSKNNLKLIVSGVGKSGIVARKIAATFSSVGSPSFFVHPGEANHGDLGMIKKGDSTILISNSGETSELTNIIIHCKKSKIPIISRNVAGGPVRKSGAKFEDFQILQK